MRLPLYQVDAFTDQLFAGNPAAVVPLSQWLPETVMQKIAAENNLAETAFILPDGDDWAIRWFTPEAEIDLCGHATLASAFVISHFLKPGAGLIRFSTQVAGELRVTRQGERFSLDFPARPGVAAEVPADVLAALGAAPPPAAFAARDLMLVYDRAEQVAAVKPDFATLARTGRKIIITAPGDDVDFVSRFFAPSVGIAEDPVTGSAHCTLIPYWADRLGKPELTARQISARGGQLWCRMEGQRVQIAGHAVLYLEGNIHV
ncbi:PhzF family phenazine biosynthesis isomerase [Niveispirillum sp. SYP-B3756]|uniref:PhzF family phenazine biosynthesis protein n=1 Tax=Niveispirillum sp. SYP-B3756 TaxID=2662178 RepID=UPI00129135E9|nr:PhzF family phenazine biosynthesis protein [Niveispirillum sp. SYP-B3756]MQP65407.1 PhzF family phenazine biosynthesis isomerase [Niveispirillum sp. SYP-B3756]